MHKNNLNAGMTTWNNIFLKKRVPRLSIGVCRWCVNVFIKKHNKDFNGSLNDKECMILAKISNNSFYKYKKELRSEL